MSDHKPECVLSDPCSADEPRHGFCGNSDFSWCMHCEQVCDCERIKRAEDRVRESEACLAVCAPPKTRALCCRPWDRNYQRGLESAREAVARLDIGRDVRFSVDVQADALAAIDGLRRDAQ